MNSIPLNSFFKSFFVFMIVFSFLYKNAFSLYIYILPPQNKASQI